ncbi:hypothetical protein LTR36_001356 [Oleoguttula mirabilis]|uniref:Fork-head domain-containing protein n=1 Tax=Oleoguttula mirabilis TaxID=1507867 RepID=A0AAV9JP14_9PEZI|nr:hypothetical protein LTR36_001356 [Oleoguttula mirabilis]
MDVSQQGTACNAADDDASSAPSTTDDDASSVASTTDSGDGVDYAVERASVRAEIMAAIRPYQRRNATPPFSTTELIVMAVLCNGKHYISKTEILQWIVSTFTSYTDKALAVYTTSQRHRYADGGQVRCVVANFHNAFDDWRAPLVDPVENPASAVGRDVVNSDNNDYVHVPTQAGRIFLARRLEPPRKGSFPLFKLPAELRNAIYEMVMSLPPSGLTFTASSPELQIRLLERQDDEFDITPSWDVNSEDVALTAPPMNETLALLSANKQIYSEAMPAFYRTNFFHLEHLAAFTCFVSRLSTERLRHLSTLHIELAEDHRADVAAFAKATQALTAVIKLEKLTIEASDEVWLPMHPLSRLALGRKTKFTKVEQIPGMEELAQVAAKAVTLKFGGRVNGEVERFILSRVEAIKAGVEKPKKRLRIQKGGPKGGGKAATVAAQEGKLDGKGEKAGRA